jgi:rhodanese-related sulfurtransferase
VTTRRAVAALAVALGLALGGCGDTTADTTAEAPGAAAPAVVEQLPPAAFAKRIDRGDGMLINVHVPDEGEIPGTDAHIPYVSVLVSEKLPTDKDRELLIYCRSGRMSAEAGRQLVAAGYTHVAELAGGFNAWVESGRKLTPGPA